jgi:ABC-type iron transport system FetAB ATPase subunit
MHCSSGGSGSGKTVLMRAIADLDPNEGTVKLDGVLRESVPGPMWRRQVTYLASEPGWWADTVQEHFANWHNAQPLIEELRLSPDCGSWKVGRLSTGEERRLGLARALILQSRVLLLDEPTSGLDVKSMAAVESIIAKRQSSSTGVIWCTHDEGQAKRVASRLSRPRAWAHRGARILSYIQLTYGDLLLPALLVLMNGVLSIALHLRLERNLLVATIRMCIQLILVGYVLTFLFAAVSLFWTAVAALAMILFASREVTARQKRQLSGLWSYGLGAGCTLLAGGTVTIFALLTQLRPEPWYHPPPAGHDPRQYHDRYQSRT